MSLFSGGGVCGGGGFGGVELGEIFGGIFFETGDAGLAAEFDEAIGFTLFLVDILDGLAHVVKVFAGDEACGERVSGVGFIFGANGGEETEAGAGEDEEQFFHGSVGGDTTMRGITLTCF
jgi:hypothetical protein